MLVILSAPNINKWINAIANRTRCIMHELQQKLPKWECEGKGMIYDVIRCVLYSAIMMPTHVGYACNICALIVWKNLIIFDCDQNKQFCDFFRLQIFYVCLAMPDRRFPSSKLKFTSFPSQPSRICLVIEGVEKNSINMRLLLNSSLKTSSL